ncbi:hypothetical protein ACLOJK_014384 [Asimina triloba]
MIKVLTYTMMAELSNNWTEVTSSTEASRQSYPKLVEHYSTNDNIIGQHDLNNQKVGLYYTRAKALSEMDDEDDEAFDACKSLSRGVVKMKDFFGVSLLLPHRKITYCNIVMDGVDGLEGLGIDIDNRLFDKARD